MQIKKKYIIRKTNENIIVFLKIDQGDYKEEVYIDENKLMTSSLKLDIRLKSETEYGIGDVKKLVCEEVDMLIDSSDSNQNIIFVGSRMAANMAIYLAYKFDGQYIAIGPQLAGVIPQGDSKIYNAIGVNANDVYTLLQSEQLIFGKCVYSRYDEYKGAYSEEIEKTIREKNAIQLVLLEEYFYGGQIKKHGLQIQKLVGNMIGELSDSLSKGLTFEQCAVFPENKLSGKNVKFPAERIFNGIYEEKNRHLKYRQNFNSKSNVLVVTLPGEIGGHRNTNENHESMSAYALSFLRNYDFNVLFIKSTFAKTSGFMLYDEGKEYPRHIMLDLIEEKRKELSIPKKNVLLVGVCGGGSAAMHYAMVGGYGHVFAMQPVMECRTHVIDSCSEYFGIEKNKREELETHIEMLQNTDFKFKNEKNKFKGVIIYCNKDEKEGVGVSDEFIANNPQITYMNLDEDFKTEVVSHRDILLKCWLQNLKGNHLVYKYIEDNIERKYK